MEYPKDVLTISKKGKVEVRNLVDRGKFVMYEYLDPKTGKRSENKVKLVLLGKEKKEFFLIPLKDGRYLCLPTEYKGRRQVWDGEKAVEIGC
ncbi:MAG: hypothetical protein DRN20_03265 [Thermoplasmata archaeon]|nr:MAG: hypothetical protein DRN20_03265 [Thermoplasmata archaeon]